MRTVTLTNLPKIGVIIELQISDTGCRGPAARTSWGLFDLDWVTTVTAMLSGNVENHNGRHQDR